MTPSATSSAKEKSISTVLSEAKRKGLFLSSHVAEAMSMASSPDCELEPLAKLIEETPVLAIEILRIANATAFRGATEVTDLSIAIARLGLKQCGFVIGGFGLTHAVRSAPAEVQDVVEEIRLHSVLTGLLCRYLNSFFCLGFKGEEYAAGLLHDIGSVVLYSVFPDRARRESDFADIDQMLAYETHEFGAPHTVVGSAYANENQISSAISSCIREHHAPRTHATRTHETSSQLAVLVAACDHVASNMSDGPAGPEYDFGSNPWLDHLVGFKGSSVHDFIECYGTEMLLDAVDVAVELCRS